MRTDRPAASVPDATGLKFAIVVSRFNGDVTGRLLQGAEEALRLAGAGGAFEVHEVPGAFELPFAARTVALARRVDAVVCLGCVIRGETPHFEYICSAVAHGLTAVQVAVGVPMAFGVLTTNTLAEALARAEPGPANKGFEAAVVAIEMARLSRRLLAKPVVGLRT
jgi:6,7-dimethyl-8-ribityllumazine synthase